MASQAETPFLATRLENDRLKITTLHRNSKRAIVCFSGIRLGLGAIKEEFLQTFSKGGDYDVFFVIDKKPSWYNNSFDELVNSITDLTTSFTEILTIGSSMGGFGAMVFGAAIPNATSALAFSPQYSVAPGVVPEEDRWMAFRKNIKHWRLRDAFHGARDGLSVSVIIGTAGKDAAHARHFSAHASSRALIVGLPECDHRAALFLRERHCLRPLIDAAWSGDSVAIIRTLEAAGVAYIRSPVGNSVSARSLS